MRCQVGVYEFAKVKLSAYGINILKTEHDTLNGSILQRGGRPLPFMLRTDSDGYATFELWKLMATFGPYMYVGGKMPFDSEIVIITREDD